MRIMMDEIAMIAMFLETVARICVRDTTFKLTMGYLSHKLTSRTPRRPQHTQSLESPVASP
jgi:hypothetical protein